MTVKHTLVSLDMRVFALCSLMELHRGQKAGGGDQAVCPLCTGESGRHLWAGADDGAVFHCAGRYFHHNDGGRYGHSTADRASGRDRDRH